jgi:hypothetical protein
VDPVPDPLLRRKFSSAENRTRNLCVCSHELRPLDHSGCPIHDFRQQYVAASKSTFDISPQAAETLDISELRAHVFVLMYGRRFVAPCGTPSLHFWLTRSFQPLWGSAIDSASNRNECQESSLRVKRCRRVRLTSSSPYVCQLPCKCGSFYCYYYYYYYFVISFS